jgi:hypothetical protein
LMDPLVCSHLLPDARTTPCPITFHSCAFTQMSEKKDAGEHKNSPPEPLHLAAAAAETGLTGSDHQQGTTATTTAQVAQAGSSKEAAMKGGTPKGADSSQRLDAALPAIRSQDVARQSQRSAAPAKKAALAGRSGPRQTLVGSLATEPGAYRVTAGDPGSSGELTDEEGDPAPPTATTTPTPPQDLQERRQQQGPSTQPSTMPVEADAPSTDLAPLILEAMVVTDSTDLDSSTRNAANKVLLVEGRPEAPSRRRMWLTLLGLLTLGVAVGISVGITQSQLTQESASLVANGTAPTAPPTFAPTSVAVMEQFLKSLPEPTQSLIESDATSPQSKAFAWISSRNHPRYEVNAMKRFKQRFALATLYYATKGGGWINNDGWLNETVNECEWSVSTRLSIPLVVCASSAPHRHALRWFVALGSGAPAPLSMTLFRV